jgi:hypothetical protein
MQILFPELKPYKRHQLKVSDKHELYVDESGNGSTAYLSCSYMAAPVELVMRVPTVSTILVSIALLPSISAAAVVRPPTASLKTIRPKT